MIERWRHERESENVHVYAKRIANRFRILILKSMTSTLWSCYGLDMVGLSPPKLTLKFDSQCGGVGRWGPVGSIWIMGVDPQKWLSPVVELVSSGSPKTGLVLWEWVVIKPGCPCGFPLFSCVCFLFNLIHHVVTQS